MLSDKQKSDGGISAVTWNEVPRSRLVPGSEVIDEKEEQQ